MSDKKHSSIDWYEKQIFSLQLKLENKEISIGGYAVSRFELFTQAQSMHRQEIEDAIDAATRTNFWVKYDSAQDYFEQTFKNHISK